MAHMEQELEILREELRQVRDLAKLLAITFPTFKTPIYFPKADLPSADLLNQPKLTQHDPTHRRVPPASPTAVRIVPDLSNRDLTIPTMQQILGAHVAAPYEPHVPPVYAAGAPTFTMPAVGDPHAHLRAYCDKIVGVGRNEKLMMKPAYAPRPRPNPDARNAHTYTPIVEPYAQLFERLRTTRVLQPVEGKLLDPIPRNFYGNKQCAYHSGIQGHDTKDCYGLKNQIESLIIRGVIKCTPTPLNVKNNLLPNHENREVNMVILDDEYGTPDYPNIDEADAMTSSAQPVIIVQLREPLTVQTYLPRVVVTTLITKKPEYDTKAVPWDYRARPKSGLGPKSNGIVEPIQLKHQRGTNDLGYEPALGRFHQEASDTIFIPEQSSILDQAGVDDITEGIGNMFMAMAREEEGINLNKLTICNVEPGETCKIGPPACPYFNQSPGSVEK
ncbi:hypothetical protein H5410_004218 [Solanum commersonii]|uniref:Gag-pro-like protein n=1 Tax=Solanum commersonii TaxID=4109 RepID=A0A9J6B6T0_SOLCO|nr:hypothetical protein H5410_004218 [Solanum commersonii]